MNERNQEEGNDECRAKEKRGHTLGFQISITTMQLERCNVVPRACSQVEFFGTGCVGCVITTKVIIDQGIYNVMLFTCLWKNAWEPGNACKKRKNSCFVVNNEKLYHWLIGHSTETYIKPLMKDLWNGKHLNFTRIKKCGSGQPADPWCTTSPTYLFYITAWSRGFYKAPCV